MSCPRALHHTVTEVGFLFNNVKTLKTFIIEYSNILLTRYKNFLAANSWEAGEKLSFVENGFQDICIH